MPIWRDLASTFESASRFECVDESSAQATTTMSTNIVALSYRTFCLVYILVYYACRSAICIAYGDFDGGDEDDRNGARSAVRSGGYCAAKTTPPCKTCALKRRLGSGSGGHGRLSQIQEARSHLKATNRLSFNQSFSRVVFITTLSPHHSISEQPNTTLRSARYR